MVGRMAMAAEAAASPTGGDIQPCKKRKEDDPSIKAITKYFSPLGKNVDRVLSPPKSNNIMDYFKKTSPINEKIISPVTEKESQTNRSSLENSSKALSRLKRRGKRCNLNHKLKEMKSVGHDLVIEINSDNSREYLSPKEEDSRTSFMGYSVSAMLGPTNVEEMLNDCSKKPLSTVSYKNEEGKMKTDGDGIKSNVKRTKKRKHKDDMELYESFSAEMLHKDQCKEVDDKQLVSTSGPGNKSIENILHPETNAHETPLLNDCTVTVSFEDFLKSQGENEVDQIPEAQTPDSSSASYETVNCQTAQQLPLKKVTVLAQIHSVPPKSPFSRKIASIFLKQKTKEAKRQSSLSAPEVAYAEQITHKRKSNVVIAEEELELAVLETTGSETVKSKCTAEERYQFMKAFRQPESDAAKNGSKKGPGKQKEVAEKSSKHKLEMEEFESVSNKKLGNEITSDFVCGDSHSNSSKRDRTKVRNNKLSRKKVTLEAKEKDLNTNENQNNDADDQIKGTTSSETQSKLSQEKNGLRSPRQKKSQGSIDTTPEKARFSGTVAENQLGAIPVQASTPKTNKSFNKSDLYKAEMITELLDSKSPIRMKFTRINTSERFMQQSVKMNSISNNVSKARKLVEKAKVFQHNKATRIIEETLHTPLRRSSRQQALAEKKKLQNTEESVIIPDSSISTVSKSVNKPKKLQSLNDVLGKKAGNVKRTMKSNGKDKVSSLIRKKVQKPTDEAAAVFDESSDQDSENSQDDKQFKAKRDFLTSGLPESLKRQIAKKAAVLEAYSSANSCFQTVVHVQQKDCGSLMWRLTPPSYPLLTNLREVNSEVTDITKLTCSLGEFSILKTQPNGTDSPIIVSSGWRPVFSQTQRHCLLKEIQSSNTQFPVKQYFDLLLKKQAASENNKQVNKYEAGTNAGSDNRKETKRKRKTEDHKSKRRKQMEKTEITLTDKVHGMENIIPTVNIDETEEFETIKIEDSEFGSEINSVSDFANEDMLWTEKYQPQSSSELVGNTAAIKKLHRWLCEWKQRADWEEDRTPKKAKSGSQDESFDTQDFKDGRSDSEEETVLCNTMLLIGPPGIGKTAAVYACAQELGFKIFEVNASCQRSGRQILSQLKEATQSHQVDKQEKNSPRRECSPRKAPVPPRRVGLKQGLAPKTLAGYFKISSKPKNKEEKVQGHNKGNTENVPREKVQVKSITRGTGEEESSKKRVTSLILFEEVDVIFEEDVGFLNAVKTLMTTTKRPVILTTNDPSFSLIFDGCFEEITFSTPSLINVASYLQVLCLAENLRSDVRDFAALLTANNSDIRQSILHLQFWIRSGGGYLKEKGREKEVSDTDQTTYLEKPSSSKTTKPDPPVSLPKCETGCIESLLGLNNIFLPSEDLFSFLKHEITTEEWSRLIHLLTEFQMKDVDFIYSNLEFILPLPVNILSKPSQMTNPTCNTITKKSSINKSFDSDCLEETSPVKKAKRTKCQRNMALLDDSDLFESELNYSGFITVPSDIPSSCLEEEKGRLELGSDTLEPASGNTAALSNGAPAKAKSSVPAYQCLNSITEFVDNMSLLDYCFNRKCLESTQFCKYEEFIWTKGKIKNGLSDEFSAEHTDWWNFQSCSELKAMVEALSFNECFKNISKIVESNSDKMPGKDEFEELALHVSEDRANLYFGQSIANPSMHHNAQKRLEIIKTVFSSRTPLNVCNRQTIIVEYLPVLRSICKLEKQKERGKTKRRFLHYLEGIHFDFPREILNSLANDFP
ncbi:ATPase family AAA domain-containing protein 5 isoform X2 [Rhineura floridana]|uniref:ATPase family AAA domain-containing protein 5 isoform X2 n=1 Tax=Rhineura floridana TaxID=261503 RepID=UPI002AC8868E|nr:ATPase family AAA domain-containing protein 5 isoform X2 [Rhineura floridana]